MSKAVRAAIAVSIFLIVVSVGVALWALTQRQSLLARNQDLQNQISDYQVKESKFLAQAKKMQDDAQQLSARASQAEEGKAKAESLFAELKAKADNFNQQIDQARRDRDNFKSRLDTIARERDDLMEKLRNRPREIVYRDRPAEPKPEQPAAPAAVQPDQTAQAASGDQTAAQPVQPPADAAALAAAANVPPITTPSGELYWAGVLKAKAALQMELDKSKADLNQTALQIADLKKQNSDLQLEIKQLTNDKDEIERKIKYGEDLANNLSIELARSRNDQKFVNDRADKLKAENMQLQDQIRQLSSTKVALERTISRVSDEKDGIQKKLVETESVIQGRINEIWDIKEGIDKKLADNPVKSNQVELSPIIVNASNGQQDNNNNNNANAPAAQSQSAAIISINESNNFVIVNLGEDSGIKVGNTLKVFRGNRVIATLEVIQVRKDISAADIKQKSDALRVGDVVKILN